MVKRSGRRWGIAEVGGIRRCEQRQCIHLSITNNNNPNHPTPQLLPHYPATTQPPATTQLPSYPALHTHISHGKHTVVCIASIERFVPHLVVEKSQGSASDQAELAGLILGAGFIHVQTNLDLFTTWY